MTDKDPQSIEEAVREGYAEVSKKSATRSEREKEEAFKLAEQMGYSKEDLESIPPEANMGLQCGNPILIANIKSGEVIVDLGSGGGFDVFLASRRVGPNGKAIGIDFGKEMVEQARSSAEKHGIKNVEFHQANIAKLPLPDNSVDCIISNCVINLAPKKFDVFLEMFRVLKPGGRIAISDVVLTPTPMPEKYRKDILMLIGCVAGAITEEEYREGLDMAGFKKVDVLKGTQDLNDMWHPDKSQSGMVCCGVCCGCSQTESSTQSEGKEEKREEFNINEYVFSAKITAVK